MAKKFKTLAIIPARAGSKGLPGKNYTNFLGRPLIHWPILYLMESNIEMDILVYSDCTIVRKCADELGSFTEIRRHSDVSGDTTTTENTLTSALNQMEDHVGYSYDRVAFITCTEVFRDLAWIKECFRKHNTGKYESVFVGKPTHKNFWEEGIQGHPKRIKPEMKFHGNRQQKSPMWQEDTGLFCITDAMFLRRGLRIGDKVFIVDSSSVPINADIHSEIDLLHARMLFKLYSQLDFDFVEFYQKNRLDCA